MLTIEQIREKLKPLTISVVARECGIHQNSIYSISRGASSASYTTIKKLSDYLEGLYKC